MKLSTHTRRLLLPALAMSLLPSAVQAATVRGVNAGKKMVSLDIEAGETVTSGDTICIFGPKKKKLDCGKVTLIKGKVALVTLASSAKISQIKKGMSAKIDSSETSEGSADAKNPPSSTTGANKSPPFRMWMLMDPAISSPFTYSQVSYKAPEGTTAPTTLWAPGKAPGLAVASFGGQIGVPIGKKAVNLGARMRIFSPPSSVDTDYTAKVANPYANTLVSAKAFGGWLDYELMHSAMSASTFFNFLPGLDLDYSSVSVLATKKNDGAADSGTIVTATSKLMILSLRLGANFDVFLGKSFGLSVGGTALIPLVPLAPSAVITFPTGEDRGMADPITDLKTSLGHKKSGLGLEALAAVFYAF